MAGVIDNNWLSKVLSLSIILIWTTTPNFLIAKAEDDTQKELSNIQKLKDKLLEGYDANIRPVMHHSNTTRVYFNVVPLYVVDVNEELSLFQLDAWFILRWTDYRLTWNISTYDGIDHIQLRDHLIWQPDITVYNGCHTASPVYGLIQVEGITHHSQSTSHINPAFVFILRHSGSIDPMINTHLLLFPDGQVVYVPPGVLDTVCYIKTEGLYPNDTITCQLVFGSWSHNGWQMDLQIDGDALYMEEFENTNPRWELSVYKANILREVKKYNCCEETYITIKVDFPMKRRPPPELQVIWAPCVLVMAMALLMFWIPPNSCKKIILGGFLFSALCLLIVYVAYVTKSPRFVKRAVTFLQSTLYAVASAIIAEVLVINLCAVTGPCRPPEALVNILSNPLAKYALIWAPWETETKVQIKDDENRQLIRHPTPNEEWILVATGLDRLFFFIYIIILAAIHQI